ncbi:hypothetical protein F2P81_020545 [Scophthalmus maximus]|uniref:Uncharacterized protein n=1 Tax=Scophthalmus maximus TaxID=52904 RepID=A0A6A4SAL0_SCOMX|nr:hypothetical protein F2P81_020545 [Scophthalmus maximus]
MGPSGSSRSDPSGHKELPCEVIGIFFQTHQGRAIRPGLIASILTAALIYCATSNVLIYSVFKRVTRLVFLFLHMVPILTFDSSRFSVRIESFKIPPLLSDWTRALHGNLLPLFQVCKSNFITGLYGERMQLLPGANVPEPAGLETISN